MTGPVHHALGQHRTSLIRMLALVGIALAAPTASAQSGITVNIVAGTDVASSSVSAAGSVTHPITATERSTFKLDPAATGYFPSCSDKSPGLEYAGSLHSRYNWAPVTTTVAVKSAQITGINARPTAVATQKFGPSDRTATYNASISQTVTNSAESNWSTTDKFSVEQKFKYNVEFLGTGGGGETTFGYERTWGEGGSKTESTSVGSSSDVSVVVNPNETVIATLTANKGTMNVLVTYVVTLSGFTALNYNPTCEGHHYWGIPVNSMLTKAAVPTSYEVTENITVGYYSDAQVTVKNSAGAVKALVHLPAATVR